ncbi:Ubiquitin-like superfamily protein [Abeliophyllum distichum]|uniref:Ubiquitin-like superfamily protein n=1 Tax=Abeliophyllum distichum TaxID=126358 RepID=A0ABD1QGZ3_9LAMI
MKVIIAMKGCEFSIGLSPQEPILEIKNKIQHSHGIPVSSQTLTVCGWELIDGLDLDDYPLISEGTKIYLSTKHTPLVLQQHNGKIKITVKFAARKIDIEVDKTDSVRSLKEKIHIVDGTPIKRMTLFFSGSEMEDDYRSLVEYGIGEFSEIIVFLKNMTRVVAEPPIRRLDLVVQTSSSLLNAAKISVEMNDTSTVNEVGKLLQERNVLPCDDYIFIHKQRLMRDQCSLRWHGVQNGDYLYIFKGTVTRGG